MQEQDPQDSVYEMLDFLPSGVCIIRKDYSVLFWNQILERWTNIPRDSIINSKISDHFSAFLDSNFSSSIGSIFDLKQTKVMLNDPDHPLIPVHQEDSALMQQKVIITRITPDRSQGHDCD